MPARRSAEKQLPYSDCSLAVKMEEEKDLLEVVSQTEVQEHYAELDRSKKVALETKTDAKLEVDQSWRVLVKNSFIFVGFGSFLCGLHTSLQYARYKYALHEDAQRRPKEYSYSQWRTDTFTRIGLKNIKAKAKAYLLLPIGLALVLYASPPPSSTSNV